MRNFKSLILIMMIVLLTACTKGSVTEEILVSKEDTKEMDVVSLERPGIKAEEVKEDAKLLLDPESDNSKWIGINMSFEDVQAILNEEKIDLGERGYHHAGDVMKGWWFDGISNLQGPGILLAFDKAGNLFEFEITEKYKTSRGVGIGATKDESLSIYGEPEYIVTYAGDIEIINFALDKFAVRFQVENDKVTGIKVTETVLQFVLQEFMQ